MKVAGAKRDVFPGSSVSTGAKFSVAPVDSAPMQYTAHCTRWCIKNAVTNFLHQLLDRRLCFHQHFFLFVCYQDYAKTRPNFHQIRRKGDTRGQGGKVLAFGAIRMRHVTSVLG